MTQFLNWLVLIAFAAAAVLVARWMVQRAHERWKGPKTPLSMAFLYVLLLATITGVSFVVASVIFFDKLKIDDPVGALSVHLVCGIFGTLHPS